MSTDGFLRLLPHLRPPLPGSRRDLRPSSRRQTRFLTPFASTAIVGAIDGATAIQREEKKLEKQRSKVQRQRNGIRSAKALGHSSADCACP
jgi:hypothetical protein